MKMTVLTLATALAVMPTSVDAQPVRDTGNAIVRDMTACRAEGDAAARLACFDRTVAAFQRAETAREIRVVDREAVKSTKRSLFGFTLPKIDLFGGKDGDDTPEVKEITSTISGVRDRNNGMYGIALADGSTWAFTDALSEAPRRDEAITVRRGALGSYMALLKGRSAARIRRER